MLKIEWDPSKAKTRSSQELAAEYVRHFNEQGLKATNAGDVDKAFKQQGLETIEAEIAIPFLAHAPMEPLDAVFIKAADGSVDQLAGGSFGRKAQLGSPYLQEAEAVYAATSGERPQAVCPVASTQAPVTLLDVETGVLQIEASVE